MGTGTSAATSAVSTPASMLTGLTGAAGKGAGKTAGTGASASSALGSLAAITGGETGPGGLAGYAADAAGLGADGLGLGTDAGGLGTDFAGVGLDFLGADSLFQSEGIGSFDGLGGLGMGAGSRWSRASGTARLRRYEPDCEYWPGEFGWGTVGAAELGGRRLGPRSDESSDRDGVAQQRIWRDTGCDPPQEWLRPR